MSLKIRELFNSLHSLQAESSTQIRESYSRHSKEIDADHPSPSLSSRPETPAVIHVDLDPPPLPRVGPLDQDAGNVSLYMATTLLAFSSFNLLHIVLAIGPSIPTACFPAKGTFSSSHITIDSVYDSLRIRVACRISITNPAWMVGQSSIRHSRVSMIQRSEIAKRTWIAFFCL